MDDAVVVELNPSEAVRRAWLAIPEAELADRDPDDLIRHLVAEGNKRGLDATPQQRASWRETIAAIQRALQEVRGDVAIEGVLIEFPLQRLRRRIDVIVLRGNVAVVIEVKGGEGSGLSGAIAQVEDYALSLRDFHAPSHDLLLMPVAAGGTPGSGRRRSSDAAVDGVLPVQTMALSELSWALRMAHHRATPGVRGPTLADFERGAYQPTPDIVQAAKEAYGEHGVAAIRRTDASGRALQAARLSARTVVAESRALGTHTVCFVTGTPGAGKTLLGLDLVLADQVGRDDRDAAAFLSGNRPLVAVLREALVEDEAKRTGRSKASVRRKVEGALQTLLDYLRHYTSNAGEIPAERIVVFDEAQRAWDAATGKKLLGREASEPELFLEILERAPWACLVCLVGSGQEINRGEGGMALWLEALQGARRRGKPWRVVGPESLSAEVGGGELFGGELVYRAMSALQLEGSLRAYRNSSHTAWLAALLDGRLEDAKAVAAESDQAPAVLVRSLDDAKAWLRARRRGSRRVGLLASSGARRLVAEGLPPTLPSRDLQGTAHWFLRETTDFRSSNALEIPLSEYGVQGLELDYAGICWGGDLVWSDRGWQVRSMRAPKWTTVRKAEQCSFALNTYRVLLSRSRAGQVVFVPRGECRDPTRDPALLDRTANALLRAGCVPA